MPRDGSGNYLIPISSWYPPINGNEAKPSDLKALLEDVASALTQSMSTDGQSPIRNNLNMNGYRMTNVGEAQASNDAIRRAFLSKGIDLPRRTILQLPPGGAVFDVDGSGIIEGIEASFTGRQVWLRFGSGVTLKYSDTLRLLGNKDWNTNDGEMGIFIEIEAGVWVCLATNRIGTASEIDVGVRSGQVPDNKQFVGMFSYFIGDTAPDGWLVADGSEVSRSTYADLFAYCGTKHGAGDGSSTFNLPKAEKQYIRGAGDGLAVGDVQNDQNKAHSHGGATSSAGEHAHSGTAASSGAHTHTTNSAGSHSHTRGSMNITGRFGLRNFGGSSTNNPFIQVSGAFVHDGRTTNNYDSPEGTGRSIAGFLNGFDASRSWSGTTSSGGSHSHTISSDGAHTHSVSTNSSGTHSHTISSDGGSEARPKTLVLLPCIKY